MLIVAANIQAAMDRLGLNAASLARKAGINVTGVYDILSGKSRSPRLDTLGKIAEALGVSVAYLCQEPDAAVLRDQIIAAASALPEDDLRRLLATALAWRPAVSG